MKHTVLMVFCPSVKSDRIFDKHSHCNISATMDIYCEYCRDNRSYWHWKDKGKIGGDCDIFPMRENIHKSIFGDKISRLVYNIYFSIEFGKNIIKILSQVP